MAETRRQGVIREGILTGIIGATAVAAWFLIVDTINGHPLYTPRALGAAVFGVLGPPAGERTMTFLIAYTLVHYAVFAVIGIVLAAIVAQGDEQPAVLAGLAVAFVVFQVAFFFFASALSQWNIFGVMAWYNVFAANLLATALMGAYLYRHHPGIATGMGHALSGRV
jgi:hypothetical protein